MIIKSSDFLKSASSIKGLPEGGLPEFAFIGRSNVGKSSLMNMLLARKGLVKTSKKPGKTVLLNFFSVNDSFLLVDLPGYGFASRARSEQELWRRLIEEYLVKRKVLTDIFLLIDSRHGIMKIDEQMMEFLDHYRLKYTIVYTKADKLNKNEIAVLRQKYKGCFIASAVTGAGREELLEHIALNLPSEGAVQ
ncbi:MAG TPA: ribosome biogenesis GTP-binding protein YihA/YsxC [bacterium]|nr:ribosome biogenesis GTP-binding protein YihA/YsxC [bacterium]